MPSNHLILRCPLLLPPSIFPSIRIFSNESVLPIRWPKYWNFSFSISPSNEYLGLISFRMDPVICLSPFSFKNSVWWLLNHLIGLPWYQGFLGSSIGKESACNAGDPSSIPGLRRSAGEGNGHPLQYSGQENSMDSIVRGVAESDTTEWLSLSRHLRASQHTFRTQTSGPRAGKPFLEVPRESSQ